MTNALRLRSVVAHGAIGVLWMRPLELASRIGVDLGDGLLVHLDAEARSLREGRIALLVDLETLLRHARRHDVPVKIALLDQEQRHGRRDVNTGTEAQFRAGVVRSERNVIGLAQSGDLPHLADATGLAD